MAKPRGKKIRSRKHAVGKLEYAREERGDVKRNRRERRQAAKKLLKTLTELSGRKSKPRKKRAKKKK